MITVLLIVMPSAVGTLIVLGSWRYLFRPLKEVHRKLTVNIREQVIPEVSKVASFLTVLSGSAILLTISILDVASEGVDAYLGVLFASWGGFVLGVISGCYLLVGLFVYRFHYLAEIKHLSDAGNDQKGPEQQKRYLLNFEELKEKSERLVRILFWLIMLQAITFATSVIYLFEFAVLITLSEI